MTISSWFPAIIAIVSIIANGAVTISAVTRHERVIEDLRDAVQQLRTEVAVLKATHDGRTP